MNFARRVFLIAGIYGLIVLLPQYFLEAKNGHDFPPPINHPEYYYGFIGLAVVWQIVFLILSRDPVRYRPIMLVGILEKASFAIPALVLYLQARLATFMFVMGMIDGTLGVLFAIAYLKTRSDSLSRVKS